MAPVRDQRFMAFSRLGFAGQHERKYDRRTEKNLDHSIRREYVDFISVLVTSVFSTKFHLHNKNRAITARFKCRRTPVPNETSRVLL